MQTLNENVIPAQHITQHKPRSQSSQGRWGIHSTGPGPQFPESRHRQLPNKTGLGGALGHLEKEITFAFAGLSSSIGSLTPLSWGGGVRELPIVPTATTAQAREILSAAP